MLGTIATALWDIISADNFAVPRWIFHAITGALGSIGSA